ncbi:Asp-tRNA(Asn)/Glu-tRNA(Gln) amidotransferase subunit GatC [Terriglobus roseus]|uniref:Aspartyl/glutamyl-tRNA(Asn/Gln) amidotransferase subunit C n=1 Tax=Terriglobus roseus TaxID=392734 RepID=A0A1H4L9N6_9BACT|nr:Asp-tRNA(Asn)/Glu-tRNA(Gln) amidotransferase subunit GatC [Terriglobus roseus]SEB67206.1 aspartyl/glutamyl-tRNA(Asn/Gln) amidotransferase subunit C [Terriglobus roseus]
MTTDSNEIAAGSVTLDEVRHVATLANLELTAEEEPRMQHDLNAILGHIAALSALDTTGVEPMAQVGQFLQRGPALTGSSLRPDDPKPSVDRAAVMHEAPNTDGRFFRVPKVIER